MMFLNQTAGKIHKASSTVLFIVIVLMNGWMNQMARATQVWTGSTITFDRSTANEDQISPAVWITRGGAQGIYNNSPNSISGGESFYSHNVSPEDTEWAYGALTNYTNLTFQNWEGWNGKNPPSMVGQQAVLHLISEDIYLAIKFTAWSQRSGGFVYERSTAPAAVAPLAFTGISRSNNLVRVTWNATAGQNYHIQYATNLISPNWTDLAGAINATNISMVTIDSNAGTAQRYYRIAQP